ncbi:hypothetical protein ACFWMU_10590 [Streptomyces sp. NPDC058357]|uniref:hypothetical protein n=1 Tax=unclassified Streptomyces TaxID=2593676 RepID=UPI0036639E6C
MPHYQIRFATDEPDRVIKAALIRPESQGGFDVYVIYGPARKVTGYLTGRHVLSVEETVVPRAAREE